jgi:nicotinate-nucleotide adenylyltransferase
MRRVRRIGLFGGTFDPPHLGHLSVANDIVAALELDELRWLVAARSPHKPDTALSPDEVRVAMVTELVASNPRFRVDDREVRRGGLSYAVDTVRQIREELDPEDRLYLVIGADQYAVFDTWRSPDEIRRHASVVVMDREGEGGARPPDLAVPVSRVDISSTAVRRQVALGEALDAVVPDAVAALIRKHGLYLGDREGVS